MAATIKLKNSVTSSSSPSSLAQGEVALNITDKKLWVGNASSTPVQLLGDGSRLKTTGLTEDSSGNLGLGVTPSAWASGWKVLQIGAGANFIGRTAIGNQLQLIANGYYNGTNYIYQNNGEATQYYQSGGVHAWGVAASGTAGNAISFTQAMTLDASGNLGVGTTSPSSGSFRFVAVSSASDYIARLQNTASSTPQGLSVYYSGASPNGTGSPFLYCEDQSALRMSVRSNGGIANYSGNNVNLSDRREKTNFAPAGEYLSKICAIPVQTFNYIDQNLEEDAGLTLGVVAQDVQAVAPELVMESNWGTEEEPKMRLSIYQTDLQYALMKCIQELKAELDSVKAELASLKGN